MSDSPTARKSRLQTYLLAAAFAAWTAWRWTVGQGLGDEVSFALWVATLILFAVGVYQPRPLPRPDWGSLVAVVLIAAALLPRLIGAEFAPFEVALDEAIHPVLGREILRNEPLRIFDSHAEHFTTPYLDLVLQALLPGLRGARQMSAILSAISLFATYALARRLWNRPTAFFAVIVLGAAYWHIAFARTGYPFMQPMAVVPLALWLVVSGLQEKSNLLLYLGGILLGVSTLVYTPARIVVPIFAAWWLLAALFGRVRWRTILPVALGLLVFSSPYMHRQGWLFLLSRFRGAATVGAAPLAVAEAQGWFSDATRALFTAQIETAVRAYSIGGGWMAPHSVAPGPLLDRYTLTLAVAGLLLAIVRLRRCASWLLLIWVAAVFCVGQVLTDVPQSAYRAGPALPALAIAAGFAVEAVAALLTRLGRRYGAAVRVALAMLLLATIAPPNADLLAEFFYQRGNDPGAGVARTISAGSDKLTYFIIDLSPRATDPRFQILTADKDARDVPGLSDLLGEGLAYAVGRQRRGAVIVFTPALRAAEQAIRRCYPGAVPLSLPGWQAAFPPLALHLSAEAIAGGRGCKLTTNDEQGLRATFYADDDFDGRIVRSGLDDWPVRWVGDHPEEFGSVEWRGYLNIPIAGTYTMQLFSTSLESTARIGKETLKAPEGRAMRLEARAYPVTLRYRAEPHTRFALYWIAPGGGAEAVPPQLFSPYPRQRSDRRWVE